MESKTASETLNNIRHEILIVAGEPIAQPVYSDRGNNTLQIIVEELWLPGLHERAGFESQLATDHWSLHLQ